MVEQQFKENGKIENIMALRGDIPKDGHQANDLETLKT